MPSASTNLRLFDVRLFAKHASCALDRADSFENGARERLRVPAAEVIGDQYRHR